MNGLSDGMRDGVSGEVDRWCDNETVRPPQEVSGRVCGTGTVSPKPSQAGGIAVGAIVLLGLLVFVL